MTASGLHSRSATARKYFLRHSLLFIKRRNFGPVTHVSKIKSIVLRRHILKTVPVRPRSTEGQ